MSEIKTQIFDCISKSEISELKLKLKALNGSVDFTDENGELALQMRNFMNFRKITKLTKTNQPVFQLDHP